MGRFNRRGYVSVNVHIAFDELCPLPPKRTARGRRLNRALRFWMFSWLLLFQREVTTSAGTAANEVGMQTPGIVNANIQHSSHQHICAEHPSTPSRLESGGTALRVTEPSDVTAYEPPPCAVTGGREREFAEPSVNVFIADAGFGPGFEVRRSDAGNSRCKADECVFFKSA